MSEVITTTGFTAAALYEHTADTLRTRLAPYSVLTFDSPANYEQGRAALGVCRALRTEIEARRKALNEEALKHQRTVNGIANDLESVVRDVEEPLKLRKKAADDEKLRLKREKEDAARAAAEAAARARIEAEEAELRAAREVEERRLAEERAALEAERARLAAEQKAERERIDAERRAFEAERREAEERARKAREAEDARHAAERRRIEEERAAAEEAAKAERERLAKEAQELKEREARAAAIEAARERAERDRIERERAEQEARERKEREAKEAEGRRIAEAIRIEALKPDREKLLDFAERIRDVPAPEVASEEARSALSSAVGQITIALSVLERVGAEARPAASDEPGGQRSRAVE